MCQKFEEKEFNTNIFTKLSELKEVKIRKHKKVLYCFDCFNKQIPVKEFKEQEKAYVVEF